MEEYHLIVKYNIRYSLKYNIFLSIIFFVLTFFFWQLDHLNKTQVASVLECYFSLIGIILIPSIYSQFNDKEIYDLIRSKKIDTWFIYFILMLFVITFIAIIEGIFLIYMKCNACNFNFSAYYFGVLSDSLFLGFLGLISSILVHNHIIGYMVSTLFFIISYSTGGSIFGVFNLFSMISGSFFEKYFLFGAAIIFGVIILVHEGMKFK